MGCGTLMNKFGFRWPDYLLCSRLPDTDCLSPYTIDDEHSLYLGNNTYFFGNKKINPFVTNGLSHPYYLDESILIFRDIRSNYSFLCHFSMKIMYANRIAQDGTPCFQTVLTCIQNLCFEQK